MNREWSDKNKLAQSKLKNKEIAMAILQSKLYALELNKQNEQINELLNYLIN